MWYNCFIALCAIWYEVHWDSYQCQIPVAVCHWYSAWRRERAARRTGIESVTVVTAGTGHLAAGDGSARQWRHNRVPGGMVMPARRWRYCECTVARGAWRCVMPARRSGAKFRLAACDARQAVLVQCWCARRVFYTA